MKENIAAHLEAIDQLDVQLQGYAGGGAMWNELTRERTHLQAELAAGHYLQLAEDE